MCIRDSAHRASCAFGFLQNPYRHNGGFFFVQGLQGSWITEDAESQFDIRKTAQGRRYPNPITWFTPHYLSQAVRSRALALGLPFHSHHFSIEPSGVAPC